MKFILWDAPGAIAPGLFMCSKQAAWGDGRTRNRMPAILWITALEILAGR